MIHELHELLEQAARRMRKLRLSSMLALCWLFWAMAAGAVVLMADRYAWTWQRVVSWLAAGSLISAIVCWRLAARAARNPQSVARQIETNYPELGAILLAAVEQAPAPRYKRLGYLQSAVVRGAVDHGRRNNWADATPLVRVRMAQAAQLAALAGLIVACVALANHSGALARVSVDDADEPLLPAGAYDIQVEPGNAEVERGTTLVVLAKFKSAVPPDARLHLRNRQSAKGTDMRGASKADADATRSMTRSLDDPQFVGRVPSVDNELDYSVEYAGRLTPYYRVTVFDYPELVRADARLTYPEFTRLDPKVVEDVRRVTAVEGTQVQLKFRLNKTVAEARLVERGGEEVPLKRSNNADPMYETSFTLGQSRRYKLHLTDDAGRKNKFPPDIAIDATPNRPPAIKLTRPGRDTRVSPLEELDVAAEVTDDFGLVEFGVSYAIGGGESKDIRLTAGSTSEKPIKSQKLSHLVDFEALGAKPDQIVSYEVWAENLGPDGERRRTMSDMYFAEVRPFDEIFRQGEQPTDQQMQEQSGQQGGAGQQAEQLAEIQKQIINATWTLVRRETSPAPTAKFGEDVGAIDESQRGVIQQLRELGEQLSDRQSAQFLAEARRHMDAAAQDLAKASADNASQPLRPALSAEQAAYQALLKLRAREFDVVRNSRQQGGQGGGGSSGPAQRQLQQLQLSADENRYETQSRATAPNGESQRGLDESRRLLDRLRELGRRQEDLNERLRELQSALQAARSEQERREIERQVKRLREQQREILRDADNLQGDMESSANRDQMRESREQLEEARSRVQDASEALDESRLGEAVTQGARAGRELNDLRDHFRRQTADRFTEEMRDLRNAGRELNQRQQQLSEELAGQDAERGRSLRDSGPREELTQGIQQQQQKLKSTLERMQQIVGEAEEPEPILARELYDAVGETARRQTEEALDVARQLAEAGATRDAAEAMRQADRGVDELSQRLDRAAESVLGDETEALRRASKQLDQLANQINREIDEGRGEPRDAEPSESSNEPGREDSTGSQQTPEPTSGQRGGAGALRSRQGNPETTDGDDGAQGDERRQDQSDNQPPGEGAGQGESEQTGRDQDGVDQSGSQQGGRAQPADAQEGGNQRGDGQRQPGESGGQNRAANRLGGLEEIFRDGGGVGGPGNVITGEDFRNWADRMRDVEDMLGDPDLSAEVARIRDRAQEARIEYRRHSRLPDWSKLHDLVSEPLNELRTQINEEIRRKESPDALAPIDRDTPPAEFAEQIRRYYQRLGSGE
jgi:hypothetical protein